MYVLLLVVVLAVVQMLGTRKQVQPEELSYTKLLSLIEQDIDAEGKDDLITDVITTGNTLIARKAGSSVADAQFKAAEQYDYYTYLASVEQFMNDVNALYAKKLGVDAGSVSVTDYNFTYGVVMPQGTPWWMEWLPLLVMMLLFAALWYFLIRSQTGGNKGVMQFGKSRARMSDPEKNRVTFNDVAGLDEEKGELAEIVEFLRNPQRFTEVGARIPKGVLLVGPPGNGKTLLARAVSGEAKVPFFTISGSDFVEMFVGVGASRVRDLFRQAKEKSPCIIFIDEIDAVGRARSKNPSMGGNDERENTLNALLTEMDGFGTNSGVIILAATNRADMLDSALLRAGRFDRQITVDLPDLNERKEIFIVHLQRIKLDDSVDIDLLSRQTPGFSGADIANVCNEAALIAARRNAKTVCKQDFLDAVDRIIGGLEKKTKVMTAQEKRTIALHEAGHATISWFCEHANPLVKVSIVPRGRALGAAWYLPEERQITTKEEMLDEMCSLMGGRAAEELFTGHISTGAINDLERATKSAYGMIAYAGMGDELPNICYYNQEAQFQRPYSETTAKVIDQEVLKMVNEQYDRAKRILLEHKEGHNQLAELLISREVIFAEDVEKIFGKRPWKSRTQEIMNDNQETKALEAGDKAAEGAAANGAATAAGTTAADGTTVESSAKAGEAPTLPAAGTENKDNNQDA